MSESNISPPHRSHLPLQGEEEQGLRAAIYARTSSPSREFGYSLDGQVQACFERCQARDWTVEYIFRDENESGADQDRPQFKEMMAKTTEDRFDVIVFWKLDRFSRSLIHAVQLEEELRDDDIYLHSVTEQIDTTSATGRFNFRNIANAAEFEREMIVQRTKMSMHELASEHKWPNDNPPIGYGLNNENRLEIKPNEAELVRRIFNWYTSMKSMPSVASKLNQHEKKTKKGNEWTTRAVGKVLRNGIYKGQYEVADLSEYVPEFQIVSEDLFQEVEDIRYRFQRGQGSREDMEASRKQENVESIISQYKEYIGKDSS